MKHKHIIPHKAVADRLAAQGIKITKEAVGLYRNGVNGSKYAAQIDATVVELARLYAASLASQMEVQGREAKRAAAELRQIANQ